MQKRKVIQSGTFILSAFVEGFGKLKSFATFRDGARALCNDVVEYVGNTPAPTSVSDWEAATGAMREVLEQKAGFSRSQTTSLIADAISPWGDKPRATSAEAKRKAAQRAKRKAAAAKAAQEKHDEAPSEYEAAFWALLARTIEKAMTLHSFNRNAAKDIGTIKKIVLAHAGEEQEAE